MDEIVKHINDTNASYRPLGAGDAKNTDLFLDNEHYQLFEGAGEHITVRYHKENLAKAILFIASILPRKFDQSSVHCVVPYSKDFVINQLSLLDALFVEDGKNVETITQEWNARKDVPQKNGKIDTRFYFNGLLKDVIYRDATGKEQKGKFTIRNYFAGGYSELRIRKADDGIFDIEIDKQTGTVYIGTEKGLCSVESNAVATNESMSKDNVWAYPNPVKPDYTGLINIVGLAYDSDVKITTTNGVLVAEGRSTGGSFQWDGCDKKGRRVASGIYMVNTATQSGDSGTVCKIAVIN